MGKLDRKIALIAGGTAAIGLAAARAFRDEGARVTVTGRNPASVTQARTALGVGVDVVSSDSASYQDTKDLFADLARIHGRVDVLFIDDVDFQGAFFTLKRAVPLLSRGSSVILNANANPAVVSLTRVAAAELAGRGIRVNAVRPGPADTTWYVPDKMRMPGDAFEGLDGVMRECTLMERFGTPEEIAKTALLLASEDFSYLLGSAVVPEGHRSLSI